MIVEVGMQGEVTPISIAVVEWNDCFLIGQRPAGVPLAGLWEFPGGKVMPGESPAEAAVRECSEETGLTVQVVGTYSDELETYDHGTVHLHFFRCRAIDASSEPPSARPPYRWVKRAELCDYDFPSGNRRLLELLMAE
jgi:8-oxo-dGTP diphosphatase